MQNQELLSNNRRQLSKDGKEKPGAAVKITVPEVPKRPAQFLAPFRLELAGNRLSPLHEW